MLLVGFLVLTLVFGPPGILEIAGDRLSERRRARYWTTYWLLLVASCVFAWGFVLGSLLG